MLADHEQRLRRGFEAFNRGDDEAWIADWHADAELYELGEIPDAPAVYRGHDGILRWLANARQTVADFRFEPREFTEVGEAILIEVAASGTGESSGVPIEWTAFMVVRMREGKIASARGFLQREQALEAARAEAGTGTGSASQ